MGVLGKFPLPIEVIPMARSYVARQLFKFGGQPIWRENFITDNGNEILDVHDLKILNPPELEQKLNQIFDSELKLTSGGYLVINPTEALVSIDINSGQSIKEVNIEKTALKTNLEAAEEISRQIKIRDLSGLIVIDSVSYTHLTLPTNREV